MIRPGVEPGTFSEHFYWIKCERNVITTTPPDQTRVVFKNVLISSHTRTGRLGEYLGTIKHEMGAAARPVLNKPWLPRGDDWREWQTCMAYIFPLFSGKLTLCGGIDGLRKRKKYSCACKWTRRSHELLLYLSGVFSTRWETMCVDDLNGRVLLWVVQWIGCRALLLLFVLLSRLLHRRKSGLLQMVVASCRYTQPHFTVSSSLLHRERLTLNGFPCQQLHTTTLNNRAFIH